MPVKVEDVIRTLGRSPVTRVDGFEAIVEQCCNELNTNNIQRVVIRVLGVAEKRGLVAPPQRPEEVIGSEFYDMGYSGQDLCKKDHGLLPMIYYNGTILTD